jgi:hypothetical protein
MLAPADFTEKEYGDNATTQAANQLSVADVEASIISLIAL